MDSLDDWGGEYVGFVGDLHANSAATSRAFTAMAEAGCDTVISVGDLGVLWPADGRRYVNALDRLLDRLNMRLVFVDGNHEGWPALAAIRGTTRGKVHELSARVHWADRGARWTWNGVTFGALGGAYSIDAATRTADKNWWPDLEEPDESDVDILTAKGHCDVLVTHDTPLEVHLVSRWPEGCPADLASRRTRALISHAVGATGARHVFHGHWHHRHETEVRIAAGNVAVHGLGSDSGPLGELWVAHNVRELASTTLLVAA